MDSTERKKMIEELSLEEIDLVKECIYKEIEELESLLEYPAQGKAVRFERENRLLALKRIYTKLELL